MVPDSEHLRYHFHGRVQVEHYDQLHSGFCFVRNHASRRASQTQRDASMEYVVFPGHILDPYRHHDRAAECGMLFLFS
jgi:hypothetical protein